MTRVIEWLRYVWCEYTFTIIATVVWLLLLSGSFAMFDGTPKEWTSERLGGHSDDAFGALMAVGLLAALHRAYLALKEQPNEQETANERD